MLVAYSPDEISAMVAPRRTAGATTEKVRDIASLATAQAGDLSFLGNPKYKTDVAGSRASVVLLPPDFTGQPAANQLFLFVDNPSLALARVCSRIEQLLWPRPVAGIHPSAVVAPGAQVDPTASIGPLCVVEEGAQVGAHSILQGSVFLGRNATVGANCWIMPGCVIATECRLGQRVRLQPGVVIGSDGFGYEFVRGRHEKVPQVGLVVIEDDVEIGANSAIDRARFSRTVIGEGTKIDNLVQIGHNVVIGKHCILCGQVGISGSTTVEDYVVLAGQVGVGGHITIGKASKAAGQAGIGADVPPNSTLVGTPAMSYMVHRRLHILHERLPDLFRRVEFLEQKIEKASATG
ncbi:MAG TPA: UDP-3-O-(3-hydroxymyristoyl)glucosamine N-acyltransferase [Candidatus Didemnitutus sp.]|nr:UDP-3-O-(3-hydroxymyristoyl)glucosamine N-acyltransferase [Candidatus Didemnitutus sp.]